MKKLRLGNAPSYSHDGRRIAYSHNGNIWIMDSDGYNATTLVADGNSWSPSWSHDDKRIVYVNVFEGIANVWVTYVDDMETYQVTDFTEDYAGRPSFGPGDKRIILTRTQEDESDVVSVLGRPDVPLVDSEPITKDRHSAGGIYGPEGRDIVFSSTMADPKVKGEKDPFVWNLWRLHGETEKARKKREAQKKKLDQSKMLVRLKEASGNSPAWLRPVSRVAAVGLVNPPTPTAVVIAAKPEPTVPAARPARPAAPVAKPARPAKPEPAAKPARPAKPAASKPQAKPKPAQAAPTKPVKKPARPTRPEPSAAPTQPAIAAAALKLRVSVGFDPDSDELELSALPSIQRVSGRLRQYPSNKIRVYGPLDTSPLKGRYPSNEARSKARAQKVASVVASTLGIPESKIKTIPYAPQALGGATAMVNGVQLYVQLK